MTAPIRLEGRRRNAASERPCLTCGVTMEEEWFASPLAGSCSSCEDQRAQNRPWTPEQTQRLIEAGRSVLTNWSRTFGLWAEEDLVRWRELTNALDRRVYDRD